MPNFKIINNLNKPELYNEWSDSTKFNCKNRLVDRHGKYIDKTYKGHKYRLISKKECDFNFLELSGRRFLCVLAIVCSLGTALFSKSVIKLFTKQKKSIRFGTPIKDSKDQTIESDMRFKDLAQQASSECIKQINNKINPFMVGIYQHFPNKQARSSKTNLMGERFYNYIRSNLNLNINNISRLLFSYIETQFYEFKKEKNVIENVIKQFNEVHLLVSQNNFEDAQNCVNKLITYLTEKNYIATIDSIEIKFNEKKFERLNTLFKDIRKDAPANTFKLIILLTLYLLPREIRPTNDIIKDLSKISNDLTNPKDRSIKDFADVILGLLSIDEGKYFGTNGSIYQIRRKSPFYYFLMVFKQHDKEWRERVQPNQPQNIFTPDIGLPPVPQNENSLDIVSAKLVSTFEGRQKYLNFLKSHPDLDPIHKLYGLQIPTALNEQQIKLHTKKIFRHIHPDKADENEKLQCTELFNLVNDIKEQCINGKEPSSRCAAFHFGLNPSALLSQLRLDPTSLLEKYIEQHNWTKAREIIEKIQNGTEEKTSIRSILACIALVRLGFIEQGISFLPSTLTNTKDVLETLKEELEKSKSLSLESVQEVEKNLRVLLDKMNRLTETYDLERGSEFYKTSEFKHIIPHHLFVKLKDCYGLLKNNLNYEKYLREAIRACPSSFFEEKLGLVNELKEWVGTRYPLETFNIKKEIETQINIACEEVGTELEKLQLHGAKKNISLFLLYHDVDYLKSAIELINKSNLKSATELINKFIYKTDNYFPIATTLESLIGRLQGFIYYFEGKKNKAAHEFAMIKDDFLLGLMEVHLKRYQGAINTWIRLPKEDPRRGHYIFKLMNFYDTSIIPENSRFYLPLKNVCEAQHEVLVSLQE
jgi:hypothetical protein